jgi:hypothetical protein
MAGAGLELLVDPLSAIANEHFKPTRILPAIHHRLVDGMESSLVYTVPRAYVLSCAVH